MAMTSEMSVARRRMVQEQLVQYGIRDERVLDAMGRVPRHRFVDPVLAARAYSPNALPIGGGQTISHPRVVAFMTQALGLQGSERVLEIGTGSGYQTVILALLAREVWSLERLPQLAARALTRLREMGCTNVHLRCDAGLGWPDAAPFDAILASASAPEVPGQLLAQLTPDGGRLVLPVGRGTRQQLLVLERRGVAVTSRSLGSCRFVPLLGPRQDAANRSGGTPAQHDTAPPRDETLAAGGDGRAAAREVGSPGSLDSRRGSPL
jgi:protein-L-isoaspartate(D-aspartate) O-methyltransferase